MNRLSLKPSDTPVASAIAGWVLTSRVFREITVPRTEVKARMRLLTRAETQQVDADAMTWLADRGYKVAPDASSRAPVTEWHMEIAFRSVAIAVRDMASDTPLAPLETWRECDDKQIEQLWSRYQDLEEELDPLEAGNLDDAQVDLLVAAVKKKDVAVLRSFGSRTLARFLLTTESQHQPSETQT